MNTKPWVLRREASTAYQCQARVDGLWQYSGPIFTDLVAAHMLRDKLERRYGAARLLYVRTLVKEYVQPDRI